MNKIVDFFEQHLGPLAEKIDRNRYIGAIKDGFLMTMPLLVVGSIFLLLAFLPFNGYNDFMASIFGEGWMNYLLQVYNATVSLMTIFVIVGVSASMAKSYSIDSVSCIIISLAAFLILLIFPEGSFISIADIGAKGIFLGLISTILSVEIINLALKKNWVIKMPDSVPSNIKRSFNALIPGLVVFIVFNFIRILFMLTPYESAMNFIYEILQAPLVKLGSSLPAIIIVMLFESVLWAFGIHGSTIIGAVMQPVWLTLTTQNAEAYLAGKELPNIITNEFVNNFIRLGGAGATIGLLILVVFFARSSRYKSLGKVALIPNIFQINEPILFGMPIVMNPLLIIPLVLTPAVIAIVCYIAFATGLVPRINGVIIPWTTPPFISGFLLCGWRGTALQIVCAIISTGIYYPFFKMEDNKALLLEKEDFKKSDSDN